MTNQPRDRWNSRLVFILAAVGSAVGLGNIWRYPHAAFSAGGGAFLIPYFIALLTAGIPLLMLEFGLGHRMQGSAPASYGRAHPKWESLGWWAAMGGLIIAFYYTVILAWVSFYCYELVKMLVTAQDQLPWDSKGGAATYLFNYVLTGDENTKHAENVFAPLNWGALLLNGLMWLAIYVTLRKGAESIGKIIIPTITIPLVLLFILFFTAINLDGSSAGLSYYLSPDWSKMDSWQEVIKVAQGAYGQIFFSLSIGFGTMVAYASFLPKKADINNSAMIAGLTNSGVEFFGGFITFSVLGFLALNNGVFVSDAVEGGFGLALVSYPTTISQLPFDVTGQALIGLAFFGSLFLLGYTSAFSLVEPMVIGIVDKFGLSRVAVLRIFCLFGWVVGIIFCTPGGFTLLDTVDHYLNSYGLLGVGLMQCILVGWVYGPKKLRDHLNHVSERRATWFWDFCIKFFTPTVLILLLSLNAIDDLRFLWSDEGQLYSNYTGQTQLIGVGAFALTIVAAVFFAQRKTNKQGYHDIPEFDYGSK